MSNPLFVKSNDTALIESLLRDAQEGDLITYDQMTAAIGRDVREHACGSLCSARRIVERDGIHTEAVRNEGIKRLTPGESVGKAKSHVDRSRRAARRGRQTVETTDFSRLSQTERHEALAVAAQSGAIELFGTPKAHKRLTAKAQESSDAIPIGATLALFQK